ncbi:MAG: DNA polymerase I, partial [Bdellovibrionota bacterium]
MAENSSLLARLGDPAQTLYLIDISSFIFRAFFAIRASLRSRTGEPTNAVYGVAQMLARLADEAKPDYLAVVYDSKEPSFRKEIYKEYKANRSAPPDDLIPQFARIEDLVRRFEIHSYRQSGVEADDLIATLTKRWIKENPKHRVVVVSGDKDLMQLVSERVQIWDTMNNKIYGPKEVEEKFGVRPDQIRDYLALVGDSSDNIPGVPSVGPKTASDLLKAHGTLDGVLKAAKSGAITGKKGETIAAHEQDALLSAKLATVHEELPVEIPFEELKYHFHVTEDCVELLRELDFQTLIVKWGHAQQTLPLADHGGPAPAIGVPHVEAGRSLPAMGSTPDMFRTIDTEAKLHSLLTSIEKAGEFGFDLETTSLNPRAAEIVGVAIATELGFGNYIPIGHRGTNEAQLPAGYVLEKIRPFLENPRYKKIGQNLKYDFSVLYSQGMKPSGIGADTMVAGYVLDPEGKQNLQALAAHYLNYNVMTYEEVCGKGKDALCFDQIPISLATRYSAEDAVIALRLWDCLRPKLESDRLMEIFARVDLPMVDVLCRMELEGVNIDVPYLKALSKDFEAQLHEIEKRIGAFTQGPINLNSTKQLGQLLFEQLKLPVQSKTKTGFSTDASVLQALAPLHEVPRLLLEYREITKLKGTYVDPLPELRDAKDGKIHASFHQTVAATGRLSSSDPNLQNIPTRTERGMKIRRAFIPSPGNVLLASDYSQIELRLLAHMSGDTELVKSFKKDEDVHRRTASEIFAIDPEKVDDRQRGIAKAINFGLMYGKTPFGLAQELRIPQREAKEI